MSPREALAFIEEHGIVLQAARGPVPSLAEAIAGGPIRGSWWGHPRGRAIFRATQAIADSPDVLVCKLVDGRVTYVHRRLWPALVKLAGRFPRASLAWIREEHMATGEHRSRRQAFPSWVSPAVRAEARALALAEAEARLAAVLPRRAREARPQPKGRRRSP